QQLQEAERAVRDQLDGLAAQFDQVKIAVSNIDRDIDENTRAMNRLVASTYVRSYDGIVYQAQLPPSYYQMQSDNQKLARERQEDVAKLDELRRAAKQVQANLPVPKYS